MTVAQGVLRQTFDAVVGADDLERRELGPADRHLVGTAP